MITEIECNNCGASTDSLNAKAVCIHCFRKVLKENQKLNKKANKYAEAISLMADGVEYEKLPKSLK